MAYLFLGNVDFEVSEEEIQEFLARYGFPRFDAIQHFPGNGFQPAVLLSYKDKSQQALRRLLPRIHHLFWKRRRINALVPTERFI